ncbi:MAG: CRISPR-associated endonuclease Cas2 [Lachnospiraceae bacterium]
MFVVLAYDVKQHRIAKVHKICRKYLQHKQKSVFEGIITEAKLNKLKKELQSVIDFDEDSICVYAVNSTNYLLKEEIGVTQIHPFII